MSAHVGGYQQAALRHRFERFQRCDQFRQTHGVTRICQDIDQIVITLHFLVRHATGKYNLVRDAQALDLCPERRFLRSSADQQKAYVRQLRENFRKGVEQQVKPFVSVKRPDETDQCTTGEPELCLERFVGAAAGIEGFNIDGIGNHCYLFRGNAARDDVAAQSFADSRNLVGPPQRPGFKVAGYAVAQTAFPRCTVIDGGIFPESANFINDRQTEAAPDAQRGNGVEHRRMGMQDMGADFGDHLGQAFLQAFHQLHFAEYRPFCRRSCRARRTVKVPAVDVFLRRRTADVFGRSQVKCFPAQAPLPVQDRQGAECIAAVQRNRMIEDVQDTQSHYVTWDEAGCAVINDVTNVLLKIDKDDYIAQPCYPG